MNKCTHDFIPVFIDPVSRDEENVVRWCTKCGAVRVDVDLDGRTFAGNLRKLQIPTNSQ